MPRFYFNWRVDYTTGWGVCGTHLAFWAMQAGYEVIMIHPLEVALEQFPPFFHDSLRYIEQQSAPLRSSISDGSYQDNDPHSRALVGRSAEDIASGEPYYTHQVLGRDRSVALFVVETEDFLTPPNFVARFQQLYSKLVVVSHWNRDLMLKKGFPADYVKMVWQAVNHKVFFPHQRDKLSMDNFYIFSGGKVEPRKGHDLILPAFAEILHHIPEAVLITAWQWDGEKNSKINSDAMKLSPHPFVFNKETQHISVKETAALYGIPPEKIIELSTLPNGALAEVFRESHCAIYPSRCEGGTNIIAMETIASGVPTIVSDCTGHRDLLTINPLLREWSIPAPSLQGDPFAHLPPSLQPKIKQFIAGWGWPTAESIVQRVLEIYQNYEDSIDNSMTTAMIMGQINWQTQTERLLEEINACANGG